MEKIIGQIKVLEVVDNSDGTATVHFDVPDNVMKEIKKSMGWKRWSNKKFNELVLNSLDYYARQVQLEKGQTTETTGSNI